jgi:hypothetical protein
VKLGQTFVAHRFQKPDECRVLNLTTEGQTNMMRIGAGEIRQGFALPNRLLEDQVHALS